MRIPMYAPTVFRSKEEVTSPRLGDDAEIEPAANYLCCAAACSGKAGFGACVARCALDGQVCDGGINNCTGGC
jgi:hypothetical protein